MSYDNACKYLAEQYPQVFLRWLLGIESENLQILKTELIGEPIRADALLWLKIGQTILHLEFQTEPQSEPPLALRMLVPLRGSQKSKVKSQKSNRIKGLKD